MVPQLYATTSPATVTARMNPWSEALERYADTVVRRTGKLLATLATSNGARRRVDWLLDTLFVAVVDELEAQNVPRRVVADMFGTSHRTLQRRYAAAVQSSGQRGRSTWVTVIDRLREGSATREEVAAQITHVPPVVLASVLHDMLESGWIESHDGTLRLAVETGRAMSDDELRTYVDVRRRAEPTATIEEVAADLAVDAQRLAAVWDLSDELVVSAEGENRWMAMERCAGMVLELLNGSANDVESGRYGATIWSVRLDDKPLEFRKKLRGTLRRLNQEVIALVEPHAIRDNEGEGRWWTFAGFQTVDLPDDEE